MSTTICCAGCGKSHQETRKLIAIKSEMFLCDECINLCVEILHEDLNGSGLVTVTASELDELRKSAHELATAKIWIGSIREAMSRADATISG